MMSAIIVSGCVAITCAMQASAAEGGIIETLLHAGPSGLILAAILLNNKQAAEQRRDQADQRTALLDAQEKQRSSHAADLGQMQGVFVAAINTMAERMERIAENLRDLHHSVSQDTCKAPGAKAR